MPDFNAEYGRVMGLWALADFTSAYPGRVPAKSLRGEVVAYPDTHAYLLTNTAMIGEVEIQSQVITSDNQTVDFNLAPGWWVLEFRLYSVHPGGGECAAMRRAPYRVMQVTINVAAGQTYWLDRVLAGDYGRNADVEWFRKADGSLWVVGPGVAARDGVVVLSGSGFVEGAHGEVIIKEEKTL